MKKILLGLVFFGVMSAGAIAQDDFDEWEEFDYGSHGAPALPPRIFFGVSSGYGRIFHSEGISNSLNSKENFDAAQSNSYFIGLCAEYFLGRPSLKESWPQGSKGSVFIKTYYLHLNSAESSFSESGSVITQTGEKIIANLFNSAVFKASFINTEAMYFHRLFSTSFALGGGFGVAFPLSSSIEKRQEITTAENVTLSAEDPRYKVEQNGRALVFKENDISNTNVYAKLGVQANFSFLGSSLSLLTPSIFYNFGLNKATSTENFKINSLQFGLDLKAAL